MGRGGVGLQAGGQDRTAPASSPERHSRIVRALRQTPPYTTGFTRQIHQEAILHLTKGLRQGGSKAPPLRPMNQSRGTRLGWRKMGSVMLNEHKKSHLCPPHTPQGPQDIHPDLPAAVLKPACQALDHLQAFLKNSQTPPLT